MRYSLVHLFLASLVLVGLVFLNAIGILSPVLDWGRLTIDFLATPIVDLLSKLKNFFLFISQLKDLALENQILTQQVEKVTAEVVSLEKAREENRILREALGFQGESNLKLVPAEIIAQDQLKTDQKFIVNRGKKYGVETGAAVVNPQGVLVGMVREALENTAEVELITSSGVVVNAEVVEGRATGIVRGEHGLGLLFDLVSQTEVIKPGDRLVTSGLGGGIPKNLMIGEIGKIRSSESELFQKASVLPATNLHNLRVVLIVKK